MTQSTSATEPLVSVIVPNWNGKHLVDACLTSLLRQTYPSVEIVFVDNGSTDGSVEHVRAYYPTVRVVENGHNLGFAAANNVGIRNSQGDFVFALNNDTEVDPDCLARLVAVAESEPSAGMCATKIYDFARRDVIDVAGVGIYPDCSSRGRGRLEVDVGQYSRVEEVFGPSGAAGFYRRSMLEQVGLFDDDFFMYCEDTDLAFRGRLAGWRCLFVPDAIVYHVYSATGGRYSPLKAYLVERNRFWTAAKVLPWPALLVSLGFTAVRLGYQAVGALMGAGASGQFAAEQSKADLVKVLVRAYWAGFAGLPRMLEKRRQIQATRRVSGREIRRWFRAFRISARDLALRS